MIVDWIGAQRVNEKNKWIEGDVEISQENNWKVHAGYVLFL